MRILLVEDHQALRSLTAGYLVEKGFVVDDVASLGAALAALSVAAYDAMIIDLGLPDGDGRALLNGPGRTTPALILTAHDSLSERIDGLNAGADDYLVKPFDLDELQARLRAVLRRPGARNEVVFTLGRLTFDSEAREASVAGQPLTLRRRETLLLEALLAARGRVVVRDVLDERLYGHDEAVTPNALEAAVSRLRRVLGAAEAGVVLATRRGIGYQLRAEPV
jgi:DNA-binding response OmpR family regulator